MFTTVVRNSGQVVRALVREYNVIGKYPLTFGYVWGRILEDGEFEICRLYYI